MYQLDVSPERSVNGPSVRTANSLRWATRASFGPVKDSKKTSQVICVVGRYGSQTGCLPNLPSKPEPRPPYRRPLVRPDYIATCSLPGMDILFVRHGQPQWAIDGLSQLDPHLTGLGREQAGLAAIRIATDTKATAAELIVSPATRSQETAQPVARETGLGLDTIDDLLEILVRYHFFRYATARSEDTAGSTGSVTEGRRHESRPIAL